MPVGKAWRVYLGEEWDEKKAFYGTSCILETRKNQGAEAER